MSIYEYVNYREFIKDTVKKQGKKGHGLYTKMAERIGISAVLLSQILNGTKNLSIEHGYEVCSFFELNHLETDFFIYLLQLDRAGTVNLKKYYKLKLEEIKKRVTSNLEKVVAQDIQLKEEEKAVFHSDWIYSAIRLLCSIKGSQNAIEISKKLSLSRSRVEEVLMFLVEVGLVKYKNGFYEMGPNRTHLDSNSPYIKTRQVSWRVKAFEKMNSEIKENFFFTGPMSISKEQYKILRAEVMQLISELSRSIVAQEPEVLACLNIDLFEI